MAFAAALHVQPSHGTWSLETKGDTARRPGRIAAFATFISQHEEVMSLAIEKIIDLSLELDPKNFAMRTPAGFKKDMQFEMEVLKEHDAPGGAGQIVRGVHMRLHARSHVDAPEDHVRGGTQIHQLPLELFMGDAIVADLRDKMPGKAITEKDLEKRLDNRIRKGDR